MTSEVGSNGYFVLGIMSSCQPREVINLELNDFNHQNVISDLSLSRTADEGLRIELLQCYGLFGFIEARTMTSLLSREADEGVWAT